MRTSVRTVLTLGSIMLLTQCRSPTESTATPEQATATPASPKPVSSEAQATEPDPITRFADALVEFDHPHDWNVETSDESEEGATALITTLDSPHRAIVTITSFQPPADADAQVFLDTMKASVSTGTVAVLGPDAKMHDDGVVEGKVRMFGADQPSLIWKYRLLIGARAVAFEASVIHVVLEDRSVAVYMQSPAEDIEKNRAGFEQIAASIRPTAR